ncbi:hypothetical protein BP6252_00601 [Coleophoma cylindrospora]|uniref:Uncharacterized protein n=1 Tax=Coleophoma cylindrospora TaxID=1849047 RepID=A0A3D8SQG4_9HELO|nr:hypothetical protein BP6252_00601 [Coleophoma cylindrospora]
MAIDPLTKDVGVAKAMAEGSSTQATHNKADYHVNILTKGWKADDDQKKSGRSKEDAMRIANLAAALLELEFEHGTIADLLPNAPLAESNKRTAGRSNYSDQMTSKPKKEAAPKVRKSSAKTPDDESYCLSLTLGSTGKGKEIAREKPPRPYMPIRFRLNKSSQEVSDEEMDDETVPQTTDFERRQANIESNNKDLAAIAPLEVVIPKKTAVPRPWAKASALLRLAQDTENMEVLEESQEENVDEPERKRQEMEMETEIPEEDLNEPDPKGRETETETPEENFDEPEPERQEMEDQFDYKPAHFSGLW